jgi:twitching motility two-component system response regulator PilH
MPIQNILIVDDSETDRHSIEELLSEAGFHVTGAESAEQAWECIARLKPDLILMDIVMPGQNGFQATRELSRADATRDIPIILCTSKGQPTDRIWGLRQGAREYVVKPIDSRELLAKIAALALD